MAEKSFLRDYFRGNRVAVGKRALSAVRKGIDLQSIGAEHPLCDELRDFIHAGAIERLGQVAGCVYLISGHAQAGLVKLGKTRLTAEDRAKSLYTAAVLLPLHVLAAWSVHDRHWVETEAHRRLTRSGVPRAKEFFQSTPEALSAVVNSVIEDDLAALTKQGLWPISQSQARLAV